GPGNNARHYELGKKRQGHDITSGPKSANTRGAIDPLPLKRQLTSRFEYILTITPPLSCVLLLFGQTTRITQYTYLLSSVLIFSVDRKSFQQASDHSLLLYSYSYA